MPRLFYERGRLPNGAAPHQRIFVATPVTDGRICDNFVVQLANTALALAEAGIAMDTGIESYNCHVDDARNSLVRQFMATDCTDLVFIDADVGWSPDDLVKLVGYDRDIVAGIYPKKQDTEDYPVYTLPLPELRGEADGLLRVARVPTGFLRIRRHVIERLLDMTAPRSFQSSSDPDGPAYHPIFERTIKAGRRWSGDYEFCNKATEAGFGVYIDPEMSFTHSGGEKVWHGCLGDYWRRINGITHPDFDAAIEALRRGPATAEHLVALTRHWGNAWAATPELLGAVHAAVRALPAGKKVLEAGSGLSTLVMAAAAEQSGAQIIALEHDVVWAEKTRKILGQYGFTADIVAYSPLEYCPMATFDPPYWYRQPDWLKWAINEIGMVLIDGPPRKYRARDNIHNILGAEIAAAHWFMDDAEDLTQLTAFKARTQAAGRDVHVLGKPGERQFAVSPAPIAKRTD